VLVTAGALSASSSIPSTLNQRGERSICGSWASASRTRRTARSSLKRSVFRPPFSTELSRDPPLEHPALLDRSRALVFLVLVEAAAMTLLEAAERVILKSRWHITDDEHGSSHLSELVEVPVEDLLALSRAVSAELKRDAEAVEPGLKALHDAIWGEKQ
jgi:hypothetical protein